MQTSSLSHLRNQTAAVHPPRSKSPQHEIGNMKSNQHHQSHFLTEVDV